MVGGPYDGWNIPCADDFPPPVYCFAGLPYRHDRPVSPLAFEEGASISNAPRIDRIDYRRELLVQDDHRNVVVYSYWHAKVEGVSRR